MQEAATNIVSYIVSVFGDDIGKAIGIFIISMIPVIELRGSIPIGYVLNVPWEMTMITSILGNLLPVPFILFFIVKILNFMELKGIFPGFVLWLKRKADKKSDSVSKRKFLGLMLFVAIPLPGTGAWTGALVASLLYMNKKESFFAIMLGVFIASIIMTVASYGLLGAIF